MSRTCTEIHEIAASLKRFHFPFDEGLIPSNGVYLLFEEGEKAHGGDRIVRIGTHTGQNQLPGRLKEHFVKENKDRSIFRKNIGRALLKKDNDPFLAEWNRDMLTQAAKNKYGTSIDWNRRAKVESQVSAYIRDRCSFAVVEVDQKDRRLALESRLISTVSLCDECGPSAEWLGLSSPNPKIRESGLWLVNELYKTPLSDGELEELRMLRCWR